MQAVFFVFFVAFASISPATHAELYTALVHMENLVTTEAKMAESLHRYVAAEEARLNRIKTLAQIVGNISNEASANVANYLGHPVNAYRLLRRFVSDWREVEDLLNQPAQHEEDFLTELDARRALFPTSDDVSGAATALMRLQHTYALSASDIVDGRIPGDQKEPMAAADCFYLGTVAYEAENFEKTKDWMEQTLRKIDEEQNGDINIATVYDYLAYAEYKLGNLRKALRLTRELVALDPEHTRAASNIRHYESLLAEENRQKRGETGGDLKKDKLEELSEWERERRQYEKLCREPVPLKKSVVKQLSCFYTTGRGHPRLILKPIRVEVAFVEPTILLYRNVLGESEMNRLKELAYSRLNRATAFNSAEGKYLPADYRISKSSWLGPEIDDTGTVQLIDNRIEAMTGLSMETAEQLQVVNYGIGGQYEPHFDYARRGEEAFSNTEGGNRIATVLFYMSDVEAGGATVFTKVGARITPSKGDASFWYNLLPSGEGDSLTRHAGCPVLSGTKWVCNKWIHERGQEFRKKCKRDQYDYWDIHVPQKNY